MKTKLHLVLTGVLILCSVFPAISQIKIPYTIGTMSEAEYDALPPGTDSSTGAIILMKYEYQHYSDYLSRVVIKKHIKRRTKILTEKGLNEGNLTIEYPPEMMDNLEIYVYNRIDGNIETRKIDGKDIFKVGADNSERRAVLPGIKVGSVIDIAYSVNTFSLFYDPWVIQSVHPVVWCFLKIAIPNFVGVAQMPQGFDKFDETYEETKFAESPAVETKYKSFLLKNVPPFASSSEAYSPGPQERIMKMDISMVQMYLANTFDVRKNKFGYSVDLNTWPNIWEFYTTSYRYSYKDSMAIAKNTKNLIKELKSKEEKCKAIYTYITTNYVFNEKYTISRRKSLAKLDSTHTGNSADLNFLLFTMLQQAGFETYPVFLSIQGESKLIPASPSIDRWSHFAILTQVENTMYVLDATTPELGFGMLADKLHNYNGVFIIDTTSYFYNLSPDSIRNSNTRLTQLTYQNGLFDYHCEHLLGTYDAYKWKKKKLAMEEEKSKLKNKLPQSLTIKSYNWEPGQGTDPPKILVDLQRKSDEDLVMLDPFEAYPKSQVFAERTRLSDIQFPHAATEKDIFIFTLSPEFQIEQIPKEESFNFNQDQCRFDYTVDTSEGQILVRLVLEINGTFVPVNKYSEFHEFMQKYFAKRSELVLLKRKKL